jgi:hypothetical protein
MRPDEGLGDGIDRLAALVHHAYLFWDAGALTVEFPLGRLAELREPGSDENEAQGPPYYAQVPQRRIWAEVVPGEPPEPMDGCFVYPIPESAALRVLGVFGLHPERLGFSVVEVTGPRPNALARVDGSAVFSPTLPGGAAAKLFSVAGEEELLDLAWRTHEVAIETSAEGTRWRA